MKKLILPVFIAVMAMSSCTKDRTCTCTETNSKNSDTDTYKVVLVGTTKSQAKANCVSTTYESGTTTYTEDCKLD